MAIHSSCTLVLALHDRTEVKLLCEDVQLGTSYEDNWCNPRTLSTLVSQISNFEDMDEDKTDLLGVLHVRNITQPSLKAVGYTLYHV